MVVLSSYLPGESPVQSERYEVIPIECHTLTDYWQGFDSAWSRDEPIIGIEHDMEWSDDLITGLLDCPEPLCTYAYRVFVRQQNAWRWAAWNEGYRYIEQGTEHAEFASIGFCKIAPQARIAPIARTTWRLLELDVNRSVRGPWHIHWPAIQHLHDYRPDPVTMLFRPELYVPDPLGSASEAM